jgi:hypothetical protein
VAGELAAHDLPAEQCLRRVRAHGGPLAALALAPDGLRAATATTAAEPLRLFDLVKGACVLEMSGHERPARTLAFAAKWLVSATEDELKVWDVASGTCVMVLEGLPGPTIAVAPSGRFAVSAAPNGTLLILGLAGELIARLTGHFKPVDAAALAADERVLATGGRDGTVRVWELASGACRAVSEVLPAPVRALAVAPEGRTVAVACEDGTVAFVALATAKVQRTLATAVKPVALAYLKGGQLLAVAAEDGRVQLVGLDWQLDTGGAAATLETALSLAPPATGTAPVFAVGASPARQRLPDWLALGGTPAAPVRARIASTALALTAPIALMVATWTAAVIGASALVLFAGWRAGQEWARLGAMAALLALAAACGWSALSPPVDLALAAPCAALALAALAHAFLGEWDGMQAIPGAVIVGVLAFYGLSPEAAVQCLLLGAALMALALLDGVRAAETERWFAARRIEK